MEERLMCDYFSGVTVNRTFTRDGESYTIREYRERDRDKVKEVAEKCFNRWTMWELEDQLRSERILNHTKYEAPLYYIVVINNTRKKIVGFSALECDSFYVTNLSVGFTGVDPDFRGLGLATSLVSEVVRIAKTEFGKYKYSNRLYASAWRMGSGDEPNIHRTLDSLKFRLVFKAHKAFLRGHTCSNGPDTCALCTGEEDCRCYEDLYYVDLSEIDVSEDVSL